MSTESVSSHSPLQLPQLLEDQLSEEELEMVAGGVLNELHYATNYTPAVGGNGRIPPSSSGGSQPVGDYHVPHYNDGLTNIVQR